MAESQTNRGIANTQLLSERIQTEWRDRFIGHAHTVNQKLKNAWDWNSSRKKADLSAGALSKVQCRGNTEMYLSWCASHVGPYGNPTKVQFVEDIEPVLYLLQEASKEKWSLGDWRVRDLHPYPFSQWPWIKLRRRVDRCLTLSLASIAMCQVSNPRVLSL